MSLTFSPSMCVGGSLCILGMAVPFRKVPEHFGVSGYISRWCLGWCDSWSLLVQEAGRGQVVDATQEEPALPAHRADCPKGCVPQSHPSRADDSCKATWYLPGSPQRSAQICKQVSTQIGRHRGYWASNKAVAGIGGDRLAFKDFLQTHGEEQASMLMAFARLCLCNRIVRAGIY